MQADLPPEYAAIMRLFEDDVTPENVEQHIEDYLAKLRDLFPPSELEFMRPYREKFLEGVRLFAAYETGGRNNAAARSGTPIAEGDC